MEVLEILSGLPHFWVQICPLNMVRHTRTHARMHAHTHTPLKALREVKATHSTITDYKMVHYAATLQENSVTQT